MAKRVTIQYTTDKGAKELLQVDATLTEGHGFSSKVTSHPVEDGSEISDHVIKSPRVLTITGIISDNPFSVSSASTEGIDGVEGNVVGNGGKTEVSKRTSKIGSPLLASLSPSSEVKLSKTAMEIFESIYEEKLLLTIITGLRTYSNMVMENFSVDRNSRTANSLSFSASFKEVFIAVSEVIDVPIEATTVESAVQKQNKGRLATSEAERKEKEKGSSLLFKLKGGL